LAASPRLNPLPSVVAVTMAVYLVISLSTSLLMYLYGYAIAVEER